MADEVQETSKQPVPNTRDVTNTKRTEKSKVVVVPQVLFNSSLISIISDPLNGHHKSKKDPRQLVLTPQGKQVLSSDACLHLEKIKRQNKSQEKQIGALKALSSMISFADWI